eukprot:IDg2706t1
MATTPQSDAELLRNTSGRSSCSKLVHWDMVSDLREPEAQRVSPSGCVTANYTAKPNGIGVLNCFDGGRGRAMSSWHGDATWYLSSSPPEWPTEIGLVHSYAFAVSPDPRPSRDEAQATLQGLQRRRCAALEVRKKRVNYRSAQRLHGSQATLANCSYIIPEQPRCAGNCSTTQDCTFFLLRGLPMQVSVVLPVYTELCNSGNIPFSLALSHPFLSHLSLP